MAIIPISSAQNPLIKQVKGLLSQSAMRRKSGLTVLEGFHLLEAYARQGSAQRGAAPQALILTEAAYALADVAECLRRWPRTSCYLVPESLYASLRTLGPGVDVMAVIEVPEPDWPRPLNSDVLILECVQDAGNVGTLLRTAAAAGVGTVLATTGTAQLWSPRVLRAGMGAHFGLQLIEQLTLDEAIAQLHIPLYVTSSHAETTVYGLDLTAPCAWILGNEGQGASAAALDQARAVSLPQPGGQESLNVAVAGSICLYEMVRQRWALSHSPTMLK